MKFDGLISHNWHPVMGDALNIDEKWDKNEKHEIRTEQKMD